jgi:hypothetical protein
METSDYRLTAARNFLATAPDSDFTKLLAEVVDVADDFMATDLDEGTSKVTIEGGVYLAPADIRRLCPACLNRATENVTI